MAGGKSVMDTYAPRCQRPFTVGAREMAVQLHAETPQILAYRISIYFSGHHTILGSKDLPAYHSQVEVRRHASRLFN